jgi:serine protease inhibitor
MKDGLATVGTGRITMKSTRLLAVMLVIPLTLLTLSLASCGGSSGPARPARNGALSVEPGLVEAANDFGFRLYRQLAASDGDKNLFISPASIEMALAMTYNGARNSTQTGMATALGFGSMSLDDVNRANGQLLSLLANPDPKVDLFVANALWTQQGLTFDPGFLQRNQEFYEATVQGVPFTDPATADLINQWANDHTLGAIKEIVTAADIQDNVIELTNAVYFKGPWTDPFDPAETRDGAFTKLDGSTKTLPMMRRTGAVDYLQNDLFQAVQLPYGDKYVAMYVFLPMPDKTLTDLAAHLTPQNWTQWVAGFNSQPLFLQLPRFKASYGAKLNDPLSAMGMGEAFDPTSADFSGFFAPGTALPGNVYLTHAIHKTYLSVDEAGTTAAAVTAVGGGVTSAPPSMLVNRPFFVVIADKPTGVILFLGSIADPQ